MRMGRSNEEDDKMKFKDTCLYKVLIDPADYMSNNCFYYSMLRMPYFVLNYTVGILLALCVDFYGAMKGDDL